MTLNPFKSISNKLNKDSKNLLIIGNGFDLKCGLKSTFSNFFKSQLVNNLKDYKTINTKRIDEDIDGYMYEKDTKVLIKFVLSSSTRMSNMLGINTHDKLYNYVHYIVGLFWCLHYQLFGDDNSYKEKSLKFQDFNNSELFRLLIYVYSRKRSSEYTDGNGNSNELINTPKEEFN